MLVLHHRAKIDILPEAQFCLGFKRGLENQKSFSIQKMGAFAYQPTPITVFENPQKCLSFRAKMRTKCSGSLFCVSDTVSTPSLPRKNFKGDKVMIRFFMPIYSPINSEIGLNLKRATLQGIKP